MVYRNILRNASAAYVSGGSTWFFYPTDYSTLHFAEGTNGYIYAEGRSRPSQTRF